MRLDIFMEKRYLYVEDDQEEKVKNMEDNPEMRYECDFKIFIFRNITFYDIYDEEWD